MENPSFYPDCYFREKQFENGLSIKFRGLIASARRISNKRYVLFIGTSEGEYKEIVCITNAKEGIFFPAKCIGIEGSILLPYYSENIEVDLTCDNFSFF